MIKAPVVLNIPAFPLPRPRLATDIITVATSSRKADVSRQGSNQAQARYFPVPADITLGSWATMRALCPSFAGLCDT